MKKNVLITGAAGFLGSHLCDYFLSKNFKVIGIDNLITGNLNNLSQLESNFDFEFRKIDITKAINILKWKPEVSRKKGLKKTFNYFRSLSLDELNKKDHKFI